MPFDELTEYLLQDRKHAKISPEMLEMMGKQAANALIEDGVALNESIAKLAGVHPDINAEQVKRVCEFANTAVYLAKHDQAKTAGAQASYPQFELADAGRVVQDLTDGARPTQLTSTDVEYGKLPQKAKLASATSDALLADLFGVPRDEPVCTKTAAIDEVIDSKRDLQTLRDNLLHTGEQFDLMLKEASEKYYDDVKRHLLAGGSFVDVARGAYEVFGDLEMAKEAMVPYLARLYKEKVAKPQEVFQQLRGFSKVAGLPVDPEHPFVTGLGAVASFQQETEKIAVALEDVDTALGQVGRFLKERIHESAAG